MYAKSTTTYPRTYVAGEILQGGSAMMGLTIPCAGTLAVLWLLTAIIVALGQDRAGVVEGSTWTACICLFLGASLFIYVQEHYTSKDWLWNLIFQLQMVCGAFRCEQARFPLIPFPRRWGCPSLS